LIIFGEQASHLAETRIYKADKVFTGNGWLDHYAVIVNDGRVSEVIPFSSLPQGISVQDFPGCIITPALIDLQIYGADGRLFAVYPQTDSLVRLKDYCYSGGAAYCLPTVATNATEVFYRCIDAVKKYWDEGGQGIIGLHVEGPWISKAKRGAHIESFIHSPALDEVKELLEYGKDVIKIITLAPEVCSAEVIDYILSRNIVISAGHSDASYVEASHAFTGGIQVATHLYNAMSGLRHREPGLVGAIFDSPDVMASIIPDGHHVDYAAIRIAKKVMGERLFVITDAVTETNEGFYQHHLVGDKYESAGILSGSALTMNKAMRNLINYVYVDLAEALRMCSLYPATVLGLNNDLGKIEKGFKAKMTVMNQKMEVVQLID